MSSTPFYVTLYASPDAARDRAVAEVLVHADRPGDVLASAFDERLAVKFGVAGFIYDSPLFADRDTLTIVRAAGVPVIGVRAIAPPGELLAEAARDRGRSRGGIALAIATLFFLAATWRDRGGVLAVWRHSRWRSAPSHSFRWRVFPTRLRCSIRPTFLSRGADRSREASARSPSPLPRSARDARRAARARRNESRAQAISAVAVVAGVGPFLLRDLARGIQFPEAGVTDRDVARLGIDTVSCVGLRADGRRDGRSGGAGRAKGDPAVDCTGDRRDRRAARAGGDGRARRIPRLVSGALGGGHRRAGVRAPRARPRAARWRSSRPAVP